MEHQRTYREEENEWIRNVGIACVVGAVVVLGVFGWFAWHMVRLIDAWLTMLGWML